MHNEDKSQVARLASLADRCMSDRQIAKLQAAVRSRGWTWYHVSQRTGIRQSRFSLWLGRKGKPTFDQLYVISRVLDIPMEWFCIDDDVPPPDFRTEHDRMLLSLCHEIGPEEAVRRLVVNANRPAGEVRVPGVPEPERLASPPVFLRSIDMKPASPKKAKAVKGKPKR